MSSLSLDEVKRRHVELVLLAVRWNKMQAAELLAVDRRSLYRMVQRWDLVKRVATAEDVPELERLGFLVELSEGVAIVRFASSDGGSSSRVVVGAKHARGGHP